MQVEVGTTDRGLPRVKWVQRLPMETQGRRLARTAMIACALVGGAIGYAWGASWQSVFGGALVGALLAMWALGKSMEIQHQQEWAAKPVLTDSKGEAYLTRQGDGELTFNWSFGTPDGDLVGDTVPLTRFEVFELGTMNEWFAGSDDKKKFGDCFAIVLHVEEGGTKCVAAHAGNKGELAQLHSALTGEFVVKRAALSKRRALTSYRDDIPKTL
jgi:hypothetical protein